MEQKKILYFEEEKWFADTIIPAIDEKTQYTVTLVVTPAEFFEEINSNCQYDLFILDIMVPMSLFTEDDIENKLSGAQLRRLNYGLDVGVVFYEKIREIDKYKGTPVIFYTAKKNPQIVEDKVKYFSKPAEPEIIIDGINDLLKKVSV